MLVLRNSPGTPAEGCLRGRSAWPFLTTSRIRPKTDKFRGPGDFLDQPTKSWSAEHPGIDASEAMLPGILGPPLGESDRLFQELIGLEKAQRIPPIDETVAPGSSGLNAEGTQGGADRTVDAVAVLYKEYVGGLLSEPKDLIVVLSQMIERHGAEPRRPLEQEGPVDSTSPQVKLRAEMVG